MKKGIFIVLWIFILISNSFATKMRIAILDFKADGVPKIQSNKISELIRNEMVNSGAFLVIERAQVKEILKEQGFQNAGCTNISCAVEMGKLLSAKKILVGTIMKLGGVIVITGRIVDVEKGVAEFSEKAVAKTTSELYRTVVKFVSKLDKRILGKNNKQQKTDKKNSEVTFQRQWKFDVSVDFDLYNPVADYADAAKMGFGGSLYLAFDYNNILFGLKSGGYYFDKNGAEGSFTMIPVELYLGYRIDIFNGIYITPDLSAGLCLYFVKDAADSGLAKNPSLNAGMKFGYLFESDLFLQIGGRYNGLFEGKGPLHSIALSLGAGYRF